MFNFLKPPYRPSSAVPVWTVCEKGHTYDSVRERYCQQPECTTVDVTKVVGSPKGRLVYVKGFKYPQHGAPVRETQAVLATIKRAMMATARLLLAFPSLAPFFFIRRKKLTRELVRWLGDIYEAEKATTQLLVEDMTPSGRALLHALLKANPYDDERWCYCLVMIWEYDDAYRYRGQDILPCYDRSGHSPLRKEVSRLLDIELSRERNWIVRNKVWAMKKLASVALLLPSVKRFATKFFRHLDLDQVRMDVNDVYWVARRFDYDYDGKTYEERQEWLAKEHEGWVEPEPEPQPVRTTLSISPESFKSLSTEEVERLAKETSDALLENHKRLNAQV